jgi:hypothetical protein
MPPPRPRAQPDDSRSEASSTREKLGTSTSNAVNGKGRRIGAITAGSSLRDVVSAGQNSNLTGGFGASNSDANAGVIITSPLSTGSSH